jgi:histidinol-phosphate aminotransferase
MKTADHLDRLPAYTPIEPFEVLSARYQQSPEEIIKLDANENPYGMSPRASQALAELRFPHIYPDPESRALRAALEQFTGVPAEFLIAGAGADELIDLLLRVLLEPGDRVLNCPPTFGMYRFDTYLNRGEPLEVPRRTDFSLDLEAVQQAVWEHRPKVLFLAAPNNPDGSLLPAAVLDSLLELPLLVVLDEAYIEFSGLGQLGEQGTRLGQVPERDNLVVLRTFSKWAGLAGLRVGYGAFPRWLLPSLWKAKQPYNVNVAASAAAIASLEDLEYLAGCVSQVREDRQRLAAGLEQIEGFELYPSSANFLLCNVGGVPNMDGGAPGANLKAGLAQEGILVRYFDQPGLRDHIRISVGRPEDTHTLLSVLARITGERAPGQNPGERMG